MVKNRTTIILFSFAFILVLTMALDNANLLKDISEKGIWVTRKYLADVLYLMIAILSWRWLKKSGNGFFKWLLVMAVLYFTQSFVGIAFSKLLQQLFLAQSHPDPHSSIFIIATSIHSALNMALSLLIALLPIYAVYNYGEKAEFLKVIKPRLLLLVTLFWVLTIMRVSIMQTQQYTDFGVIDLTFIVASGGVSILIALYGIRASLDTLKKYHNQLFKWLIAFFGAGVVHQLIILVYSILFIQSGDISKIGYMYLMTTFHYVEPLLLITALLTYREHE